ncbi:hypothetical protein SUGI_0138470 [Cryptomeria japonica]|nr:hypothetical protein SUGI_0138470 [Cryptomeria japonica]
MKQIGMKSSHKKPFQPSRGLKKKRVWNLKFNSSQIGVGEESTIRGTTKTGGSANNIDSEGEIVTTEAQLPSSKQALYRLSTFYRKPEYSPQGSSKTFWEATT